jgi:hypothetical protein
MRFTFGNPNHWRMHLRWQEMLKVKIWLWLLEGPILTSIERTMLLLLKHLNNTRLTPQQLEERKAKGLCFNCDNKYSKGHKCGEKKLFYIDCEEEEEQEQEPSQDENVEAISLKS